MTVRESVKKYLDENGYDGLCNGNCACSCKKDEIYLCDNFSLFCKPAYIDLERIRDAEKNYPLKKD